MSGSMPLEFQQAWELLSRAVAMDNGDESVEIRLPQEVLQFGVLVLHDVYYTQDARRHPEVTSVLKKNSRGAVSQLLHSVVDQLANVENWDKDVWLSNYGLVEKK